MTPRAISIVALIAVFAVVLGARVLGPGDLYDKDQPKTMAYSADVALNGNWIWPSDALHEPATKPPLYNWLDAIVLKLSSRWDEWTFKVPSILAALAAAGVIIAFARWSLHRDQYRDAIALLAAAVWFASIPAMKHLYLSRPDMLLAAFLVGAWALGTRALDPREPRPARVAVCFWLCVIGAALAKGPAAIVPVLYVLLAAKLLHGEWTALRRMGWTWGLALVLLIVGGYALLAYRQRPEAFFELIRSEAGSRFTTGGPELMVGAKPFWLPSWWFVKNFIPWSLAAAVSLPLIGAKNVLRHPLAPALLWAVLVLAVFSAIPGKRADYLLPAYPAAAILAAFAMVEIARRVRLPVAACCAAPLLMAGYLAHWEWNRSPEARSGDTRALVAFAEQVRETVPPGDRLVVLVKGYHPLLCLLRRFDGNRAAADDLQPGVWVVAEEQPAWPAHAVSGTLRDVTRMGPKQIVPGKMAQYRVGGDGVTPDALLPILTAQTAWNIPPDRYRTPRGAAAR